MRRAALAAAVLAVSMAAPAATAQHPLRPCRHGDVIGTWALARLNVTEGFRYDRNHPRYLGHQVFVFETLGGFRHVTSARELSTPAQRRLRSGPSTATWSIDERGWITIGTAGGAPEHLECQVVTQHVVSAESNRTFDVGDLLLTLHDAGRPVMRRQLVAIEPIT